MKFLGALIMVLLSGLCISRYYCQEPNEQSQLLTPETSSGNFPDTVSHSKKTAPSLEGTSSSQDQFIPTSEWQTLKDGQSVPAGLHVRLNLATGLREAKLLDPEDASQDHSLTLSDVPDSENIMKQDSEQGILDRHGLLREELERALKDIDKMDRRDVNVTEDKERVAKNFRSMDELKKDFESMNLQIRTDREILQNLVRQLKEQKPEVGQSESATDFQLSLLQDLEYYVHQIDNARDFVDMDGLSILKNLFLEHEFPELQAAAVDALGSASQSNPVVQMAVMRADFIKLLLDTGNDLYGTKSVAENEKLNLLSKILFAVSATVRQFPLAQKQLVDLRGLQFFDSLLSNETLPEKIHLKIISLINDLLIEKGGDSLNPLESHQESRLRYESVKLIPELKAVGYCETLLDLTQRKHYSIAMYSEILKSMDLLKHKPCGNGFRLRLKQINFLSDFLRSKNSISEPNEFLAELIEVCDKFVAGFSLDTAIRDEL